MLLLYGTELNITTGNEGSTDGEWIDMPWTNVKDQPRKDGQTIQSNVDIYPTRYTSFFFSFSGAEAAVCSMKKKSKRGVSLMSGINGNRCYGNIVQLIAIINYTKQCIFPKSITKLNVTTFVLTFFIKSYFLYKKKNRK